MSVQYREIKPLAKAHVPIYVKTILQNRFLHDVFVLYQPFSRDLEPKIPQESETTGPICREMWSYLDIDFSPNRFLSSICRYPCEYGDIQYAVKTFKSKVDMPLIT